VKQHDCTILYYWRQIWNRFTSTFIQAKSSNCRTISM